MFTLCRVTAEMNSCCSLNIGFVHVGMGRKAQQVAGDGGNLQTQVHELKRDVEIRQIYGARQGRCIEASQCLQ